jgi:hypothetical protein
MKNKTSHFIANHLYGETEIRDYIMNCDSQYHPDVYEAIHSYSLDTEQYIMPFSDWINEHNPDVHVIGPLTPGDYIKQNVYKDYYGDKNEDS